MQFSATLDKKVKVITGLASLLLIAIPLILLLKTPQPIAPLVWIAIGLPIAILCAAKAFQVTGFRLEGQHIIVERFVGHYSIAIADITSVTTDRQAMDKALRLFGNGGLFGFYGLFKSDKLGSFRAFVTSTENALVIKTVNNCFVISPDDPSKFVSELENLRGS